MNYPSDFLYYKSPGAYGARTPSSGSFDDVVPALGNVPLQKLQSVQVQVLYSEKLQGGRADGEAGGLSARTVRYLHTVLREALHQAMKWGMVHRNACDATDPPRAVRPGSARPLDDASL